MIIVVSERKILININDVAKGIERAIFFCLREEK